MHMLPLLLGVLNSYKVNFSGEYAIHIACRHKNVSCLRCLLFGNLNPNYDVGKITIYFDSLALTIINDIFPLPY